MGLFGAAQAAPSAQGRTAYVAALDVGASKVTCLIARAQSPETVDVVGLGVSANHGVVRGAVADMRATEAAIRAAVDQAERMAGASVSRVSVSFSGGRLRSEVMAEDVALSDRAIGERDQRRALDAALRRVDGAGRSILHAIPLAWSVDGCRGVPDPTGMYGARLGVEVNIITVDALPLRNLALCLERAHLDARAVVAAPYASGLATLVDDELDLGATIIDLGAGVTSSAVFIDGAIAHVDVAPIGAASITSDLAQGLSTPLAAAERIKCRDATLFRGHEHDHRLVDCPMLGDDTLVSQAPRSMIRSIIAPRVCEILEIVNERLESAGAPASARQRVVLTGGGARLDGIAPYAAEVLGRRVRIGRPLRSTGPWDAAAAPGYAVAAGLVRHAVRGTVDMRADPRRTASPKRRRAEGDRGGLARAATWLRENF